MSCMSYAERVADIVSREASKCSCIMFSGGIDTSFIALVYPRRSQLIAITVDLGGSDAIFASRLAPRLGFGNHVIIKPTLEDVLGAVDWVLANFRTIDRP